MLTFLGDSQALLLFLAGVGFELMTSLWAQCIFQLALLLFCGAASLITLRFVFSVGTRCFDVCFLLAA